MSSLNQVFTIFTIIDKYTDDYFYVTGQSRLRHLLKRMFINDVEVYNKLISFRFLKNEQITPTTTANLYLISNVAVIQGIDYNKFVATTLRTPTDINLGILYVVNPDQLGDTYGAVQFKLT